MTHMHTTQEKLLKLASDKNLGQLTLRGIGKLVGESYPQKIKHHLLQLQKKGLLRIDKGRSLIEKITEGAIKNTNLISIPILGTANCGPANTFAEENLEGYLRVSARLLKKKKGIFAVKVDGPSMNKALINGKSIEDGDYAVIDGEAKDPKDKEVVLSIIDGMANIKRYRWDSKNKQIILMSDSTKEFPPIYIHEDDNFMINGKVVQVIKKPLA